MYYKKRISVRSRLLLIFLCFMSILLVGCDLGINPAPTVKKLVKAPADKQVYVVPQVGISDITTLDPALVLAADDLCLHLFQIELADPSDCRLGLPARGGRKRPALDQHHCRF